MPDNWGFVAAAYGLAAVVFGGYWRWLSGQRTRARRPARRSHDTEPPPF